MPVKVNIRPNWAGEIERSMQAGLLEMATDIDRRAKILAPVDTRALANSGRVERLSQWAFRVIFGSSRVPYARRRHYENKKHPGTLRYLERAGESVTRGDTSKYFRGKV